MIALGDEAVMVEAGALEETSMEIGLNSKFEVGAQWGEVKVIREGEVEVAVQVERSIQLLFLPGALTSEIFWGGNF